MITRYAVGPAIDVVGRDYGVNHLHKSSRSLDYASDSSFSHCLVGRNFVAISDIRMFAFCRVDCGVSSRFYPVDVKVCGNTFVNHRHSR